MNADTPAKHGGCLSAEVLTDFLEGALSSVARNACEAHLIACDSCRANLALFMRVLRDDVAPEEEGALQRLAELCERREMRQTSGATFSGSLRPVVYLLASIAAVAILAFWMGYLPAGLNEPASEITTNLLQQVRPFEPRLARQPYRVLEEVTRGPEDTSRFNALEAEMASRAALDHEMGQFFLIQKKYANAIKYLQLAAEDASATAEVHNDLGVAYLQSGGEGALRLAEMQLKAALDLSPNYAPALFNLSILYEREGLSGEAEKTWLQYLQVDPESGWAQEIKRKLGGKGDAQP